MLCLPGPVWAQSTPSDPLTGADILPPTRPIFPLADVVLFPNISRPLHIFEPRKSRATVARCKADRLKIASVNHR